MTKDLTRYAWLSIATAVVTILLKSAAYWITGSVGLLSDAVESLVNLAGGVMALTMLRIAARPADEDHAFGHNKAEYFSSGVEGSLILLAAISIAWAAIPRFLNPREIEGIGVGLAISACASLINLGAAIWILRAGQRSRSITLEANAKHLLTDVWTSIGVIVAVGLVAMTGWLWLDPLIAMIVAANIIWTGYMIVRRSVSGLMDQSLVAADRAKLDALLARYRKEGADFHALMTRQSGARRFISMHVLVPGDWTVRSGHEFCERIEDEVRSILPGSHVLTHLEPLDDPRSFADQQLEP